MLFLIEILVLYCYRSQIFDHFFMFHKNRFFYPNSNPYPKISSQQHHLCLDISNLNPSSQISISKQARIEFEPIISLEKNSYQKFWASLHETKALNSLMVNFEGFILRYWWINLGIHCGWLGGAFRANTQFGGVGLVVRDDTGNLIRFVYTSFSLIFLTWNLLKLLLNVYLVTLIVLALSLGLLRDRLHIFGSGSASSVIPHTSILGPVHDDISNPSMHVVVPFFSISNVKLLLVDWLVSHVFPFLLVVLFCRTMSLRIFSAKIDLAKVAIVLWRSILEIGSSTYLLRAKYSSEVD